ncbi:hypothetical protein AN958_11932 [Leucoagaricus sp. SymC.cos]|nr:hypothetical protein AN958_11932 [Leucoagaricus sp. SymC.cos]
MKLEQRQETIKNRVASQKSLLSPIRRIPPEILGQIFIVLQSISEPICFGDDALENTELWTLLNVCRFWRTVAMSYSELWSHFAITRQPFSRPSEKGVDILAQQTLQFTKDCISYSHTRPLHFVFHANEDYLGAAELLATESRRWCSVRFNNLAVLRVLEPRILGHLPNLCSLTIDGLGKEWDLQTGPLQAFQQAPSLLRLTLFDLEQPQSRFILPWRQITQFSSFQLRQFLPILNLMPSLVEFKSTEDICEFDEIQERIHLPNLERLEVMSNSPTTNQIFDALQTPKLTALRLFSKRGFSRIYAAAVVEMIKTSGCCLNSLSVSDYAIDSIFRMLREVRDLEELTFGVPSGNGRLLPQLRKLVLRKCAPELNLGTCLLRMVRGRNSVTEVLPYLPQTLHEISIGLSSVPESQFLRSWKDIVRQLRDADVVQIELNGLFDFIYPTA